MRRRFTHENCSVARALEVIGDWWTLLVVREAMLGSRRFSEFAAEVPIARNVLTRRLNHLVRRGVLARVDAGMHGTRYEYVLTPMGKDLATVMTALRQWGDRWVFGEGREPLLVRDRRTGRPIPPVRILDESGAPISARDLEIVPGPGARKHTIARYRRAKAALPSSGSARSDGASPKDNASLEAACHIFAIRQGRTKRTESGGPKSPNPNIPR